MVYAELMMISPSLSDFKRLAEELEGELHLDATMRTLYATDAQVYREMPQAVALPRSERDIVQLVHFAREHRTALVPRTAVDALDLRYGTGCDEVCAGTDSFP
jgi:hypothetical protein